MYNTKTFQSVIIKDTTTICVEFPYEILYEMEKL